MIFYFFLLLDIQGVMEGFLLNVFIIENDITNYNENTKIDIFY